MTVSVRVAVLMSSFFGVFCTAMDATDEISDEVHFAEVRVDYGVPLGSMSGTFRTADKPSQVDRVTWSHNGEISHKWVPSLSHATESGAGFMALGVSSTRYELSDTTQRK